MSNRHYSSGSHKRKEKKAREEALRSLPSVTQYFAVAEKSSGENSNSNDLEDEPSFAIGTEENTKNDQTGKEINEENANVLSSVIISDVSNVIPAQVADDEKRTNYDKEKQDVELHQTVEEENNFEIRKYADFEQSSFDCRKSATSGGKILDVIVKADIDTDVQKDPALWPLFLSNPENRKEREKYLAKNYSFFQNKNSTFKSSKKEYPKQNRYFSPNYFYRTLHNGEKCERKWVMFSESKGAIFCFVCKLFSSDHSNSFVQNGFSNWKKIDETITTHENCKEHNRCMLEWINYSTKYTVEKSLDKQTIDQVQYWTNVLKRVVAVVQFLAEKGLAFRGTDETIGSVNNGNFLGAIELIAKFDPFLNQHIQLYANKGSGNVSYLSKTIYEEFIKSMAKQVTELILAELKKAKYWGLVLDSTPDVSHVDQLSVVFRYYLNNHVYERFFCFLPIESHTGESLSVEVLKLLIDKNIEILNCRAQTYDNARNMSGCCKGVQARIQEKNQLAFYVPCSGHSLNLVGECSVDECIVAITAFGILQELYVFFTISTYHWNVLMKENPNAKVKNLSKTRWSCRKDATKVLNNNFDSVYNALKIIADDPTKKAKERYEASALLQNICKLEFAFMVVLWNDILNRFDATSHYLQKIDVNLVTASEMLYSLVNFVEGLREQFTVYEEKAKHLSAFVNQEYSDEKKRKIKRKCTDGEVQACNSGPDNFRVNTFYVIIDKLVTELKHRSEAYNYITDLFGFLLQLLSIENQELKKKCDELARVYTDDLLGDELFLELTQLTFLLKSKPKGFLSGRSDEADEISDDQTLSPSKLLNWIVDQNMDQVFPNAYIAYRILVTIPIANCETERSFSVLKRIKSLLRSTMLQERLTSLAVLNIEVELLRSLDFDSLISEFIKNKIRKKFI